MRWKLLGLFNALFVVAAILVPRSSHGPLWLIAIATAVAATVGVFLYAYDATTAPRFWRLFSWLFVVDSVAVIAYFVLRLIQIGSSYSPIVVASVMLTIIGCHYFTWLALSRLSDPDRPRLADRQRAKSGRFGQKVAQAAEEHPQRAKIAAWAVIIAILATAPLVIWHQISTGNASRLIMPTVIGLVVALRTLAKVKKIRSGE